MRHVFIFLACYSLNSVCLHSQKVSEILKQQMDELRADQRIAETRLAELRDSIKYWESRIAECKTRADIIESNIPNRIAEEYVDSANEKLKKSAITYKLSQGVLNMIVLESGAEPYNKTIPKGKTITVLKIEDFPNVRIKYDKLFGIISAYHLDWSKTVISQEMRELWSKSYKAPPPISLPTSQYTPSTTPNSSSYTPSSESSIYTGPRGGKYYYTSSGKKRYVSQKKH